MISIIFIAKTPKVVDQNTFEIIRLITPIEAVL